MRKIPILEKLNLNDGKKTKTKILEDAGIDPATSRMQSARSPI